MGKGMEIAQCLGYRHSTSDDDADADHHDSSLRVAHGAKTIDMWHLRTLAIQPGGLLDVHGRKLGWIKLAGVDDLIFIDHGDKKYTTSHASKNGSGCSNTYEQIQAHFELEMEVSKWHIQRERRRLRNGKKSSSSAVSLSRASSANDLSSVGSHDVSVSSTPLPAHLHGSHHPHHHHSSETPKSVTFLCHDGNSFSAVPSFTAFPNKTDMETYTPLSITISCPSLTEAATFDNDDSESSSPSSINNLSLTPNLPQCQSSDKFLWNINPKSSYLQYAQRYQLRNNHKQPMSIRDKSKKDRRPQERKLLIQIASSTVNLLQCQSGCPKGEDDEYDEFHYYSGMQDLIAVLLIHVESPSLTSLLLKQIWKSHLRVYFRRPSLQKVVDNDDDDECQSFASCIDWEGEKSNDSQSWSMVSRYFPLCQVLDEELHASISRMEYGEWIVCEEIHKWVSSWFCCHDTLPMHVISRVVDFFLASHPQMPIYLSLAVLCHPNHRNKFIDLSQSSDHQMVHSPHETLAFMIQNLFSNLGQELSNKMGRSFGGSAIDEFDTNLIGDANDEFISDFIEEAIVMAISFMKQAPPPTLHQTSVLMPWTTRATAPTDYKLVQRKAANSMIGIMGQSISSRIVDEKYQIALATSGLSTGQLSKIGRCRKTTRVIILGIALCVIAQLFQLKHPFKFGLDSLLVPSKHPMLLRTVNGVPAIEKVIDSFVFVSSASASYGDIIAPDQPKDTMHTGSAAFADISRIIPTEIMPIIVDTIRSADQSYKMKVSIGSQRSKTFGAGADTQLGECPSPQKVHSTSQTPQKHEEYQHLLESSKTKHPRKQQPAVWIQQRVKRCSARSRRIISGIKTKAFQSLLNFKEEYIALVENDNFFL